MNDRSTRSGIEATSSAEELHAILYRPTRQPLQESSDLGLSTLHRMLLVAFVENPGIAGEADWLACRLAAPSLESRRLISDAIAPLAETCR
jgi:hypothetical protein